ncbi:MAG: pseudouridine synthase [Planctomycetota bacterium]
MTERLDGLLTRCGFGTRREVKIMIKRGRVQVDGAICLSAKTQVLPEQVLVRGSPVQPPPTELHLMLHKPVGYACSHDPREAPLLEELLPERWRASGIEAAGRLDRATSGLLLLSTDGQYLHSLISPKRKVPKRYQVRYRGSLRRDAVVRCQQGLRLLDDERPCRPAELTVHEVDEHGDGQATIILHEGRYHQVRRMFTALGGQVIGLHRDRIGNLELPADLAPGDLRELDADARRLALGVDG